MSAPYAKCTIECDQGEDNFARRVTFNSPMVFAYKTPAEAMGVATALAVSGICGQMSDEEIRRFIGTIVEVLESSAFGDALVKKIHEATK